MLLLYPDAGIPKYQQGCDILLFQHRLLTKILTHNACYSVPPSLVYVPANVYIRTNTPMDIILAPKKVALESLARKSLLCLEYGRSVCTLLASLTRNE